MRHGRNFPRLELLTYKLQPMCWAIRQSQIDFRDNIWSTVTGIS